MSSAIRTAIIGYGFSAKTFHIPFIDTLDAFELTAVSTRNGQALKEDWPTVEHFHSAEALIRNTDAELIIITAPNDVHFPLAMLALEHDKHLIIEKPFVTRVEDGEALIKLAAEKKRLLTVYHNRRWDGDFLTIKAMLAEQRLGEIKHFESHFDRFRPNVRQRWREQAAEGGGILFDLGPHLIDQALELFGLPDTINANCRIMREGSNNIDYFHIVLQYPSHLVVLHSDLFSAGDNKRFTIKGSKGSYEKLGLDPQEARLIAGEQPIHPEWSAETSEQYGRFYDAEQNYSIATEPGCYQTFFTMTANAIRHNSAPPVDAQDALWNIRLIELALKSSQLTQTLPVNSSLEQNNDA